MRESTISELHTCVYLRFAMIQNAFLTACCSKSSRKPLNVYGPPHTVSATACMRAPGSRGTGGCPPGPGFGRLGGSGGGAACAFARTPTDPPGRGPACERHGPETRPGLSVTWGQSPSLLPEGHYGDQMAKHTEQSAWPSAGRTCSRGCGCSDVKTYASGKRGPPVH